MRPQSNTIFFKRRPECVHSKACRPNQGITCLGKLPHYSQHFGNFLHSPLDPFSGDTETQGLVLKNSQKQFRARFGKSDRL